jgi:hypothetical protein
MQVEKIREAIVAAENFAEKAKMVLEQTGNSHEAKFILHDGKHAKILKKASNWLKSSLEEMRRL